MQKQKSLSLEKEPEDQCYVRNSSFLSRDIEAQKSRDSPPKRDSPTRKVVSPPTREASGPKKEVCPPKGVTPPKRTVTATPASALKVTRAEPKPDDDSDAPKVNKIEAESPPKKVTSPPVSAFKINRADSKAENSSILKNKKETSVGKEVPAKAEKMSLAVNDDGGVDGGKGALESATKLEGGGGDKTAANDESNGVGDKIKKFEKAAEDASVTSTLGRASRAGSVRRARGERLGSDGRDEFPPPATPFKDNVLFDLGPADRPDHATHPVERQHSFTKNITPSVMSKWQRSDSHEEKVIQKPEPQKIIKPECKPMPSPADVTIRSPSLGAKIPDQFPSHGTAFRNVASPPDQARAAAHKFNDDVNASNNVKACKLKNKEKYSVSKGSSYFTRGSEEIWLVKKKDIEEIEERVLDSFRRAGGNVCMRSESTRPASEGGHQGGAFAHATMGRTKRAAYARSESLDPQWAGARAHTLKRQTSVACTCGHDKKPSASASASASAARARSDAPRARSRSHGDDHAHVLDKYETLV